jgi:translocator protein
MRRAVTLFSSLVLAYLAAAIGSFFTIGAVDAWYTTLVKPELSPPNWLFGPVWTVLYACMAIAAWRVYEKRKSDKSSECALLLYGIHLALNAFWSIVFFGLHAPLLALGVIAALLGFIIVLTILFFRIDRIAGILFIPYLAWVLFAAYLNVMIVVLN